jgi:hypothetical protein
MLSLIGEKNKICTFTMVMQLCGKKGYIHILHTHIHVAYN